MLALSLDGTVNGVLKNTGTEKTFTTKGTANNIALTPVYKKSTVGTTVTTGSFSHDITLTATYP
ncbi:hypothetical protein D3C73_1350530 [compost metagenome]